MGTSYTAYVESKLGGGWFLEACFEFGKVYPSDLYPADWTLDQPDAAIWRAAKFGLPSTQTLALLCGNQGSGFVAMLPEMLQIVANAPPRDVPPPCLAFMSWAATITTLEPESRKWRVLYLGI